MDPTNDEAFILTSTRKGQGGTRLRDRTQGPSPGSPVSTRDVEKGRLSRLNYASHVHGDDQLQRIPVSRNGDPQRLFQELGLLNDSGKPRLNAAQGFFRRSENEEDLDLLEELYVYWRDLPEFLVLRSLHVNPRSYASEWSYVAVKSSKRGNDVYQSRVKRRLNWLSSAENVSFFSPSDFQVGKKVYSSALWITLTYDTKRCSRSSALERIGQEWNRFLSALRSRYGQVSVLRSWETSAQGYPHVHACLLFKEARFTVFPWLETTVEELTIGKTILKSQATSQSMQASALATIRPQSSQKAQFSYRIEEKDQISSLWHSHVDVQAISSTKKLFNYMRKYQTKTLMASDSPKGVRTMSILWLHRKRSFSVSGDFRARISDLIRHLHNSKMEIRQTRLDGSLEAPSVWEFVGVFSGEELNHRGEGWTFRLNKPQIELVLCREAEFKGIGRSGDWD